MWGLKTRTTIGITPAPDYAPTGGPDIACEGADRAARRGTGAEVTLET